LIDSNHATRSFDEDEEDEFEETEEESVEEPKEGWDGVF
jgi:hypothetical protein